MSLEDRSHATVKRATYHLSDCWRHAGVALFVVLSGPDIGSRAAKRFGAASRSARRVGRMWNGTWPGLAPVALHERYSSSRTGNTCRTGRLRRARPSDCDYGHLEPLMASAPGWWGEPLQQDQVAHAFLKIKSASIHIYALPLHRGDSIIGCLAIVHDSGYIRSESLRIWWENFLSALAHVVLIVLITLLIVRWSIAGPIARTAHWMRALRTGRARSENRVTGPGTVSSAGAGGGDVCREPEYRALGSRIGSAIAGVGRIDVDRGPPSRCTFVRAWKMAGLFVVSNREPYTHARRGKSVVVNVPAERVGYGHRAGVCACDGTWVAHGSGDADLDAVDAHDRFWFPRTIRGTPCGGCG